MKNRLSRKHAALVGLTSGLLLVLGWAACVEMKGPTAQKQTVPPGEVWLTPDQVRDAKIEVSEVDEQVTDDTILASGKVTFDDSLVEHVFSPVSGRVVKIDAKLGMHLPKGSPLVTIQSPDIGVASSDVGKANADLIAAEHDYDRKKDLFEHHAASQADLEASEDNYRKAKAEMLRAQQKQRLFHAGGVDTVTQTYTVHNEIEGEVIARMVNPGMEIQGQYGGGTPFELFTIGQLSRVWVVADVYEMDLDRVKVGQPAIVKVVAFPGRDFIGKVDWVSGMLDPATRTAKFRCTFDNSDGALKPEMFATVYLSVDQRKALAIRRSSFLRLGDQTVVFVEKGKSEDGRVMFERVPVTLDEGEGSQWVVVEHGLQQGQKIVSSGAILLVDKV